MQRVKHSAERVLVDEELGGAAAFLAADGQCGRDRQPEIRIGNGRRQVAIRELPVRRDELLVAQCMRIRQVNAEMRLFEAHLPLSENPIHRALPFRNGSNKGRGETPPLAEQVNPFLLGDRLHQLGENLHLIRVEPLQQPE